MRKRNVIIVGVVAVIGLGAIGSMGNNSSAPATATLQPVTQATSKPVVATDQPVVATEAPVVTPEPASDTSAAQRNAIAKADDYLAYTAFSRSGLIDQLVYEGFNKADSTYAVDSITVDWNEQAHLKAKDYLAYTSFSLAGLTDQLVYEGFSKAQAKYGATKAYGE